jgi:preprotein translocase subunit SecA
MAKDSINTAHAEADMMLELFASVGVTSFDLTWTNHAGEKEHFRRNVNLAELRRMLPALLDAAAGRVTSVAWMARR